MKYHGCNSEFQQERTNDLLKAYIALAKKINRISQPKMFETVANSPAPRFYVSAARAATVVAEIERGSSLSHMRPNKRDMFMEIHRRTMIFRTVHRFTPLYQIVEQIITQPAPKFYISASSARIAILSARKEYRRERMEAIRQTALKIHHKT